VAAAGGIGRPGLPRPCLLLAALAALSGCGQFPTGLVDRPPGVAWTAVAVGTDASCGVTAGGAVYCWANSPWSGLPYDSLAPRYAPRRVPGLEEAVEIAAGYAFFCATVADGTAHCWGSNQYGTLGIGHAGSASAEPVPMAGGLRFASLDLAETRGCGVGEDGVAYCWGISQDGALGTDPGSLVPCGLNERNRCAPVPSPVQNLPRVREVSTASHHACALADDGGAYCWGLNAVGTLGDGTTLSTSTPVRAAGELRFRDIAAGGIFTCGVAAAGEAYCWGNHNYGQLGTPWRPEHDDERCNAYGRCSVAPVRVAGGLRFTTLAAGDDHACALTAEGRLYCWGDHSRAQLGIAGRAPDRCGYYLHVPCSQRPLSVLPRLRFRSVAAGGLGTCAITAAGNLLCWGNANDPGLVPADGRPEPIVVPAER
jgi:alpha-tubulin suppressor-like RCC1 family protein